MKVLVVGLGSIARRHAKNIKTIDPRMKIAVLRQHSKESDLGDLNNSVGDVFFKESDALKWKPDVALITNPAPFHVKAALSFAKNGVDLFIEKPLSVAVKDIDLFFKECAKRKIILMVGYVLRFLGPLNVLKKALDEGKIGRVLSFRATVGRFLPDWRPATDYRKNVSARKKLGGGVVFELSHELDYARWMVGEIREVSAVLGKISNFKIDVEDVAEINLRFKNNAIGNIHLDMLDRASNRSCRIIGTEGTLVWDSTGGHSVRLYSGHTKKRVDLWRMKPFDHNRMYIAELKHFFDCVNKRTKPLISGSDGRRIVEIALAVKRSAQTGKVVKV